MGGDGSSELATAVDEMPTYAVLEKARIVNARRCRLRCLSFR